MSKLTSSMTLTKVGLREAPHVTETNAESYTGENVLRLVVPLGIPTAFFSSSSSSSYEGIRSFRPGFGSTSFMATGSVKKSPSWTTNSSDTQLNQVAHWSVVVYLCQWLKAPTSLTIFTTDPGTNQLTRRLIFLIINVIIQLIAYNRID